MRYRLKNNFVIGAVWALVLCFLLSPARAQAADPAVRLKDIAHVQEVRANQLMGFGLMVGLGGTGDSARTVFADTALKNLMGRMGLNTDNEVFKANEEVKSYLYWLRTGEEARGQGHLQKARSILKDARYAGGRKFPGSEILNQKVLDLFEKDLAEKK